MGYLNSDWFKRYQSIKAVEKDLDGFKWKGQGWYFTKTDTLLTIYNDDETVMVYCWNSSNAYQDILKLLALPNRSLSE